MFNSSVFNVNMDKVEVYGVGSFLDTGVFNDFLATHVAGKNIVTLNIIDLKNAIKNEFPSIKDIEIKKKIPPYLVVTVQERVPFVAMYKDSAKDSYMADNEGFVLGSLEDRYKDLFKVQYDGYIKVGEFIESGYMRVYRDILSSAGAKNLILDKIVLGGDDSLVYLSEGVLVILSNEKDIPNSFTIVSSVLSKFGEGEKKVSKIDLRYDKVIVSYD